MFSKFFIALRSMGLKISVREIRDAFQALLLVDLTNKKEVFLALRFTLVKDQNEDRIFTSVFEELFGGTSQEICQKRAQPPELGFMDMPIKLTPEEQDIYQNLSAAQKDGLQKFLEKIAQDNNVPESFLPPMESRIKGQLDFLNRQLPQLVPVEPTGDDLVDSLLDRVRRNLATDEAALLEQDMGVFNDFDLLKVQRIMQKLTKRLARRLARRKKLLRKRGIVDLRNSLRHSIQHGGLIFNIKYRQKRRRKPDLILICDISASMEVYAIFVLQFCYCLNYLFEQMETFCFAEKIVKLNQRTGNINIESIKKQITNAKSLVGQTTNINESLQMLNKLYKPSLTKNKIIIFVSDGKTMAGNAAANELRKVARSVKDVLWLNPLPRNLWSKYKTVQKLNKHCKMYECGTLNQLGEIMYHGFQGKANR